MEKMYSIKEIAKMAQVSTATVSRVINGSDSVSKKTKRKVQQIIDSVGYIPNEAARGLVRQSSSKVVGMIIPDIFNGYYAEMTTYIEPALREKGYSLQLCISNSDMEKINYYIDDLISRKSAGVLILSAAWLDSEKLIEKIRRNLAVVAVEAGFAGVDRICVENEKGMYQAVENLIRNGHRKIGFVGYEFHHPSLWERVEGYKKALFDHDISFRESYLVDEGDSNIPGYAGALKLMDCQDPPTAIQCMNEYCARGVYMALTERGLKIPEHVSVSGFDGLRDFKLYSPTLTTSAIPLKEMATTAVELVLNNIEGGNPEVARTITFPTTLRIGESVKRI